MLTNDDLKHLHRIDEELFKAHRVGPLRIGNCMRRAVKRGAPTRDAAIMARVMATADKLKISSEQAQSIVVEIVNSTGERDQHRQP